MKKLVGQRAIALEGDGGKRVFTVSFWIRNNEYKWSIRIPQIVKIKTRKDGLEEIELPELVWARIEKDIKVNHPISEVRYIFYNRPDRISWDKPKELEPKITISRPSSSTFAVGVSVNGFNTVYLPALDERNLRELGRQIFKALAEAKEEKE